MEIIELVDKLLAEARGGDPDRTEALRTQLLMAIIEREEQATRRVKNKILKALDEV